MAGRIEEGHAQWKALVKIWKQKPEAGYVTTSRGEQFRVHHPDDDNIFFTRMSGFDDSYSSSSVGSLS